MTDGYPKEVEFDPTKESGSLERAREMEVHIERIDPNGPFIAAFEDGEHVHEVVLERYRDGFRADCWRLDDESGRRVGRCRGWVNHEGPCAHLWVVRSEVAAALLGSRRRVQERAENVESFDRDEEDFADNQGFDWTPHAVQRFRKQRTDGLCFGWSTCAVQPEAPSYGDGVGISPCLTPPLGSCEAVGTRPRARPLSRSLKRRASAGTARVTLGNSRGGQIGG